MRHPVERLLLLVALVCVFQLVAHAFTAARYGRNSGAHDAGGPAVSATTMLPLGVRQILVWGEHEKFVPLSLAGRHVDAANRAGDCARLIVIPSMGHFESASPQSSAWPTILEAIRSLVTN